MKRQDLFLLLEARESARTGRGARVRAAADLSQAEVARRIGVTPSAVSLWESRSRRPRGAPALRWARLLRELAELRGGEADDDAPAAA